VEALLALASLHEQRGDFDQSQGYAERASQLSRPSAGGLDPTTRGKLANQQAALGDALAQAGERRDAILEYRRALDRCPTFHDIRHRLGVTLREAGLPSQAVLEFQKILRAHPRMLESQIQLGLTYYSLGRTPEAITEWEAILERDPSSDEARMYLRLVRGVQNRAAGPAIATPAAATTGAAQDKDSNDRRDSPDDTGISSWATSLLTSHSGDSAP
jgi:tetratricopeptide (TPR) repeat protein